MQEGVMQRTLTEDIISEHLVDGELSPGHEIGLRIDQTLTQDATGTMVYLGIPVRMDGREFTTRLDVSPRHRRMLVAGGALNLVKRGE
jgi:homoaconitase/3-isopropylmalate dehydratase large subunit